MILSASSHVQFELTTPSAPARAVLRTNQRRQCAGEHVLTSKSTSARCSPIRPRRIDFSFGISFDFENPKGVYGFGPLEKDDASIVAQRPKCDRGPMILPRGGSAMSLQGSGASPSGISLPLQHRLAEIGDGEGRVDRDHRRPGGRRIRALGESAASGDCRTAPRPRPAGRQVEPTMTIRGRTPCLIIAQLTSDTISGSM